MTNVGTCVLLTRSSILRLLLESAQGTEAPAVLGEGVTSSSCSSRIVVESAGHSPVIFVSFSLHGLLYNKWSWGSSTLELQQL